MHINTHMHDNAWSGMLEKLSGNSIPGRYILTKRKSSLVCTLYNSQRSPTHTGASEIMREIPFSRHALHCLRPCSRQDFAGGMAVAGCRNDLHAKGLSWNCKKFVLVYQLPWQIQYIYLHSEMQIRKLLVQNLFQNIFFSVTWIQWFCLQREMLFYLTMGYPWYICTSACNSHQLQRGRDFRNSEVEHTPRKKKKTTLSLGAYEQLLFTLM